MDFTYYYCEEKEGGFVDIVYGICLSSFLIFLRCWYLILGLFVHLAVMGGVHTADAKAACSHVVRYEKFFLLYSFRPKSFRKLTISFEMSEVDLYFMI